MRYLLFALAVTAHAAVPDFLPPDTKVVIGINVRGLVDSPLFKDIFAARGMATQYLPGSFSFGGVDLAKDIDDVTIASTGDGEKAPALFVVRGRFPGTIAPTKDYALLDRNTLVGGDPALVRAALNGKRSSLPPSLAGRVAALESRYDVWAVGEVPQGLHSSMAASPEIQAIDRFEVGASLRSGLDLAAQIHMRDSKETEKLVQTLKLLELMIAMQPSANNGTRFNLKSDQSTISLDLFIPEAELRKSIEEQKTRFASAAMPQMSPGGAAPAMPVMAASPAPIPAPKNIAPPGTALTDTKGNTVTITLPRK